MNVLIVGAGWAGTSVHFKLKENNINSVIFESNNFVGGHSRSDNIKGVIFEPNGPHIFHTSNTEVNEFVTKFGMLRKFNHQVKTRIYPRSLKGESKLLSWPPQVDELKKLDEWKIISEELGNLPKTINDKNFKTYAVSIMGATLYELFIEGYTYKQWGEDPSKLSSKFAPKRIDLRKDGNKNLFSDKFEYFHPEGSGHIIENILQNAEIQFGKTITVDNIDTISAGFDAIVLTSSLDLYLNSKKQLKWRGIETIPEFYETTEEGTITEAYQINHPSLNESYTRTIETKHASGQKVSGSVVAKEYPKDNIKHYPVLDSKNINVNLNNNLKNEIIKLSRLPVYFCGRLANYQYINQDEAILQGFECAKNIIKDFRIK